MVAGESQTACISLVFGELLEATDDDGFVVVHALHEYEADQELGADAESDLLLDAAPPQHATTNVFIGKVHLQ